MSDEEEVMQKPEWVRLVTDAIADHRKRKK